MAPCTTVFLLTCSYLTLHTAYASQTIVEKTYPHTLLPDKYSITCNKCPPGQFFLGHCTRLTHDANCTMCLPGTFQPSYSIARSCEPCSSCLSPREVIYKNCTVTRDTECRCQPGHYKKKEGTNEGVCLAHKVCPKGQGVTTQGSHVNNTACTPCETGYFSANESSSQSCQPCSTCSHEYEVVEECTSVSDTRCQLREEEEQGLSHSALAGIVGGVLLVLVAMTIVAVVCARKGQGPRVTQNLYNKYCSRNGSSKKGMSFTNGITYTPQGVGDEDKEVSERVMKLLQIFPNFSRDLIHPEWKFFFRYLFEDSDKYIHEAELNNQNNVREQIHTILKDWVKRDKEKATQERLVTALQQQDRHDLIQKYFSSPPPTDSDTRITQV